MKLTDAFVEADVLTNGNVAIAELIADMMTADDDEFILAVALVAAGTSEGSVCLDLMTAHEAFGIDPEFTLAWPEPRGWRDRVERILDSSGEASPIVLEGSRLYLDKYWQHERHLAAAIIRRQSDHRGADIDVDELLLRLFPGDSAQADEPDSQELAARQAATRQLTAIAGGPGTGKTTTIARIFALMVQLDHANGLRPTIALAAPTGRASARLKEALVEHSASVGADDDVRELMRTAKPTTLHKLLKIQPGSKRSMYDEHNPVPYEAVVVDESSMVSLSMMDHLFAAVPETAKLILVGDPQQLASVDAGSAFGDIVAAFGTDDSQGGVVMLDRVHRYGHEIASVAQAVLAGEVEDVVRHLSDGSQDVVKWIPKSPLEMTEVERADVLASAIPTWQKLRGMALAGDSREAAKLVEGARILCGHRFGPHGVSEWNEHSYRLAFGRPLRRNESDSWYPGRLVLVQENDYQLDVYNGDTGVVVDSGSGSMSVVFDRTSELLEVPTNRIGSAQTAFASTVHKSQGSQFGNVVVILPPPESRLMTRELLYTAVTRAQGHVTVVGSLESLRAAIGTGTLRQSGLRDRLLASQASDATERKPRRSH